MYRRKLGANKDDDRTGYGQHGDYVFGWKDNVLQNAMDAGCFGASCSALKTQAFTEANKCAVPDNVKENVEGCKYQFAGYISAEETSG
jgi:hypothetical protein